MIDLETFRKSLKICWIERIIEFKPFGGKLLFERNFSKNDIHRFTQNSF